MDSDSKKKLAGCFVILALSPFLTIARGFVLMTLWGWFVVPQFHVAPLSIPCALGIALVVTYITSQEQGKTEPREMPEIFASAIAQPVFTLAFGAILHHFM